MAGYSGAPLLKKLGIKSGFAVYVHQPPSDYFAWLDPLPEGIDIREKLAKNFDFIHLFLKNENVMRALLQRSKVHLKNDGMIWVSWPKKTSGVKSDLNENIIRDFGLAIGLVDIKVCAVDDVWSGLKFVIPLKDRKDKLLSGM